MPKKKKSSALNLPRRVAAGLYQADELLEKGQPQQALEVLEELDRKHPDLAPVLELLTNAYYDLQDLKGYERACYRLLKVDPGRADASFGMAGAYMTNFRPGLAIRAFQNFLRGWPEDERAADAQETMEKIRDSLLGEMRHLNLPDQEALELAVQHEQVRFFIDHGQYRQGKRVAEKLLKQYPDFVPALNNLGQIHALQGDQPRAIELARKVLEIEPENIHALSNLARYLFLDGQEAEARQMAQHLKQSQAAPTDALVKKMEAFSILGDDDEVMALYEQAKAAGELDSRDTGPLLSHLAAVVLWQRGREKEARQLWKNALMIDPSFDPARVQLEDLDLPEGERNAPWAYAFQYWISYSTIKEYRNLLIKAIKRKSDQAVQSAVRQFLDTHPEVVFISPHILARSDGEGRRFVIKLARVSESPELLAALKDFAFGQRGSDQLRLEAAHFLTEKGLLPSGPNRMYIQGEWREIQLFNFEVTEEPLEEYTDPQVQQLVEESFDAMRDEGAQRAQSLLKKAIALSPDTPSLQYNLVVALQMQGEFEKAQALLEEIHARFPDYFFARVALARLAINAKDLETARALLAGIMQRKRFHFSEINAICKAQVELCLAEKNFEPARYWLDLWEKNDPDNPELERYRPRLAEPQGLRGIIKKLK